MSRSNAGRVGVWGASGSGKSAYVKRRLARARRVVVFDPMEEYPAERMTLCHTVDDVRRAMRKRWKMFRIAYRPPGGHEPRALNQLSRLILAAQQPYKEGMAGDEMTLVVEEMNLSFPQKSAGRVAAFADICSRGRHFGVEVIGVSQRIAEVETRFRGNCTESVIFRQQGRRDIDTAAETIGVDRARIAALKNLEYVHERNGEIICDKLSFRKRNS